MAPTNLPKPAVEDKNFHHLFHHRKVQNGPKTDYKMKRNEERKNPESLENTRLSELF
nr:MAG TPA: hypothetical protein [Caudoviricetes sp.]